MVCICCAWFLGFVDIAHVDGVRFGAQLYAVTNGKTMMQIFLQYSCIISICNKYMITHEQDSLFCLEKKVDYVSTFFLAENTESSNEMIFRRYIAPLPFGDFISEVTESTSCSAPSG